MTHNQSEIIPNLEGLIYAVAYDLSKFEDGPKERIGVIYHTNLTEKPRVIAIRPHIIHSVAWVPDQGLYYASKKGVWQLLDSKGNEIDRYIAKRKADVYNLSWIPDYGLCDAGEDGQIHRCLDKNGKYADTKIIERPGPVRSLLWVPDKGLFDAGTDSGYNQIRKCLDADKNKVDELIAERIKTQMHLPPESPKEFASTPTLCWVSGIGLLDNGFIDGGINIGNAPLFQKSSQHPLTLIRYLSEEGIKCTDLLAMRDDNLYVVKPEHYSCFLHRDYQLLENLGGVYAWASVPNIGLLYTNIGGCDIHKFLDENGTMIKDTNPIIKTHPHCVTAMTWVSCSTK